MNIPFSYNMVKAPEMSSPLATFSKISRPSKLCKKGLIFQHFFMDQNSGIRLLTWNDIRKYPGILGCQINNSMSVLLKM